MDASQRHSHLLDLLELRLQSLFEPLLQVVPELVAENGGQFLGVLLLDADSPEHLHVGTPFRNLLDLFERVGSGVLHTNLGGVGDVLFKLYTVTVNDIFGRNSKSKHRCYFIATGTIEAKSIVTDLFENRLNGI